MMKKPWKVSWYYPKGDEIRVTYRAAETEEEARVQVEQKIARHKGVIREIENIEN